jgi:hypothetical protein
MGQISGTVCVAGTVIPGSSTGTVSCLMFNISVKHTHIKKRGYKGTGTGYAKSSVTSVEDAVPVHLSLIQDTDPKIFVITETRIQHKNREAI